MGSELPKEWRRRPLFAAESCGSSKIAQAVVGGGGRVPPSPPERVVEPSGPGVTHIRATFGAQLSLLLAGKGDNSAMTGRILLLGATGYTGELTARSLLAHGAEPVLLGRNPGCLRALSTELGGVPTAIADVSDPGSLLRALKAGDVLISTVGPFLKYGRTAVQVAATMGVHYLDSTGEGPFIREVFERWGPLAEKNGVALLPAFGYDFVPGALAGALALEQAGPHATALEIAYFTAGVNPSSGTRASTVRVLLEENHTYAGGEIRMEPAGSHIRRFAIDGASRTAASVPAAEHFGLPQTYPYLRDIDVFFAFPPRTARIMARVSRAAELIGRLPPVTAGILSMADRAAAGIPRGSGPAERAGATSTVVASAHEGRTQLAAVRLDGPDPYEITADLLAWGAMTAAGGGLRATGGLGPTKAFGLSALQQGCALAGMSVPNL